MAVVQVLSQQLINSYGTPATINIGLLGNTAIEEVANCPTGQFDGLGSQYRFCKIPSGARVLDVQVQNDAVDSIGFPSSYKCGVYYSQNSGGGVVVTGSDGIFFSSVSMSTARGTWESVYSPARAALAPSVPNLEMRVFELLSMPTNPSAVYDLVMTTVSAVHNSGGNVALRIIYVKC